MLEPEAHFGGHADGPEVAPGHRLALCVSAAATPTGRARLSSYGSHASTQQAQSVTPETQGRTQAHRDVSPFLHLRSSLSLRS